MVLTPILALILSVVAWNFNEQHPRTDDGEARANLIGIAPRGSGPIGNVCVKDNQFAKSGDLLFEIDPADFKTVLDSARASLQPKRTSCKSDKISIAKASCSEGKLTPNNSFRLRRTPSPEPRLSWTPRGRIYSSLS